MSILERPPLPPPPPPAAEAEPRGDRLRVVTAGDVGNIEARLGTSGFDVIAVAETEHALIDAVSSDEPDAIVVDADLCESLEHVRDLAPDAVLIVVGDHTPVGALGRIEPGVSGTVMAGLLHALIADGLGAAAVWGLVPAFGSGATLQVPQPVVGPLLYAKMDLLRAYLVNVLNAIRDHAELVTAASTVAVTVSAGVLLTMGGPRTDERPRRVPVPAPVERTPQEDPPRPAVFAVSPTRLSPGPLGIEGEPGGRREPNRGDFRDHGRHHGPVVSQGNDDHVVNQGNDDHGQSEESQGQSGDAQGQSGDVHGQNEDVHGQNEDVHGQNDHPHGKGEDDQGVNQGQDDQGGNQGSETGGADDQGNESAVSAGRDAKGENGSHGGQNEDNNDQGEGTDDGATTSDPTAPL